MTTLKRKIVTQPTATMNAAYAICIFANRTCECALRKGRPCDALLETARRIITAAKADLTKGKGNG